MRRARERRAGSRFGGLPRRIGAILLDRPVEIRAERRIRQLEAQGKFADAEAVRQDLEDRDERDQTRDEAPLVRAPGSVDIDTGRMDEAAVVNRMVHIVEDARAVGSPADASSRRVNPAPGMNPVRRFIVWKCIRGVVEVWCRLWHGLRMWNRDALPPEGPLIYIMNHQSLLDPPLVGVLVRRRPCAFLARKGLFAFKPFGAFIRFMCAIPLDIARGGGPRASLGHPRAGSRAMRVDFSRGSTHRRRSHGPLPWRCAVARAKDQCPGGPIGHRWVVGRLEQAPQVAPVGRSHRYADWRTNSRRGPGRWKKQRPWNI